MRSLLRRRRCVVERAGQRAGAEKQIDARAEAERKESDQAAQCQRFKVLMNSDDFSASTARAVYLKMRCDAP